MLNRLIETIRDLWVNVQLSSPPWAQRTIMPRLHELKELVRLLIGPYLPVYHMQGQGRGGPLTVTYIGLPFAKLHMKRRLFAEEPEEKLAGRIPFWRYDKLANPSSDDIVFIHTAKHVVLKLPHQKAIVGPRFVDHTLDVRGNWEEVQNRFSRSVRRNEMRLVRKYGYEYKVSHDRQDFEAFYHQMYVPTMDGRHGEASSPWSAGRVYQCFRHDCLLKVTREGEWVSGGICHSEGKTLFFDTLGVKNADAQLIHQGATSTLYYAVVHWANQQGYEAVNFEGSGGRLTDGQFQHKRKWGATVSMPSNIHRLYWIKAQRITPAVSQFLKDNPRIVIDKDGKLHGLIMVDDLRNVSDRTRQEWETRYSTPGMSSLIIRSVHSFVREPANGDDLELVIPIPSDPGLGKG